ncbi:hypothetical protein Lser_V15G09039 [Lactuca serriola]
MANNSNNNNENLFSSLICDIKTYNGSDPLLPWLRGIKKMTDLIPQQLLKQKLPRFLQKCAQTFETDIRYRNDLRYLRVWMKLLDFVDDPGAVLENMKANHIGNKRSLFYQAYALYYEKLKKFTDAEKMYHLGVQNLAEPQDELQKSFDQFLHRMERHKNKKTRGVGLVKDKPPSTQSKSRQVEDKKVISPSTEDEKGKVGNIGSGVDETVVVRFTKTAIVGKSKAEDARHHGLVEPTINTKEAMDAINSMFREPLGPEPFRNSNSNPKKDKENADSFKVFNDNDTGRPVEEPFQIYCDHDDEDEDEKIVENQKDKNEEKVNPNMTKAPFVFQIPKDIPVECPQEKFREDTVMLRFVGSTIADEPKVENVCHHGLVEPTVNLKEAMDDINGMFGKPIEFVRKRRPRKQEKEKPFEEKKNCSSFLILPDDDENDKFQEKICKPSGSSSRKENDLFEQTVCTKEAMDDINKMFAMPLDF